MSSGRADHLVQFLRREAGDYLRAALHYSADDHEVLYVRDDVRDEYSDEELAAFVAYYRERSREPHPSARSTSAPTTARCRCTTRRSCSTSRRGRTSVPW
ncbi:hypothetical protein ACFQRB_07650 [Halobaculum litoreum]|uniref:Uncharacterized protein n=1 Tax=Halobaculum litoreum TaxID=3031998 RepID=A0ABD5XP51_9EURY